MEKPLGMGRRGCGRISRFCGVTRRRVEIDAFRDGRGGTRFHAAAAVYLLTHLLVAAAPVVMLASLIAVSRVASNASRRGVGQWRGAGGACCEDHLAFLR